MESSGLESMVAPRGTEPHILHIEDNARYAKLIYDVLEANGYRVTHASEGASGLLTFKENPDKWAAVLVDIDLPHIPGFRLIHEMHQIRPDLPLLVLTGRDPDAYSRLYELGAVIMWRKPIGAAELLENLKAVIKPC